MGRLKAKRRSSPQRECCQQEWEKGRFSLWRRGIKVSKQIRVTRNVMESLRRLDEFGRCLFFILFYFNKSVMHSFHTYECKGTVNGSGRHRNSHLLSLQTSFFHLTFKTLCNPTPVFSSSFCILVHPLQPNFTIHPWNHPQTSWPISWVFTISSHVRCRVHLHSSSLQLTVRGSLFYSEQSETWKDQTTCQSDLKLFLEWALNMPNELRHFKGH